MINKKANAQWNGNLKDGEGLFSLGTDAVIRQKYTAESRFDDEKGIGPEDLIAAAHAGCYSMALAHLLDENDEKPEQVATNASVKLTENGDGFSIATSSLETQVHCPGLSEEKFQQLADKAAKNCPVSKALAGVEISVKAVLVNAANQQGE